jgi:hypothetical protein
MDVKVQAVSCPTVMVHKPAGEANGCCHNLVAASTAAEFLRRTISRLAGNQLGHSK